MRYQSSIIQQQRESTSFSAHKLYYALILALGSTLPMPALAANSLTGLVGYPPNLPGDIYSSSATGVSADGSVVVGASYSSNGGEAFRWTEAGGMVGLGAFPGGSSNMSANGVSADGSVVVGESYNYINGTNKAFRWTEAGGLVDLGHLPGGSPNSSASGVSADGSVVVGDTSSTNGTEAFRWTEAGGMVGLGGLPGSGSTSSASSLSADGLVVVGYSYSSNGLEAFRWTEASGMVGLGHLPGSYSYSFAYGVSADGSVVVGSSSTGNGTEAFRWTEAGGMVGLGDLANGLGAGGLWSFAYGVSADGSVVVGSSTNGTTIISGDIAFPQEEAFRWTEAGGMVSVADWLAAAGVSLAGWTRLAHAASTNLDGSVVVGHGESANGMEAYIARVGGDSSLVGLTDLKNSLASQVAPQVQVEGLNALTLNGAHHRPLMEIAAMVDGQNGGWVSGDLGRVYRDGNGWASLAEAGACHDFAEGEVRAGLGLGHSQSSIDQSSNGQSRLDGEYLLAEVDWNIPKTSLTASLLGMSGRWEADLKRGYSAGASTSRGDTDTTSTSLRARLDWREAFRVREVKFTPSLQFTEAQTRLDGYQETGGATPARFDSQHHTAREGRLGLTGAYAMSEATTLYGHTEWAHRFDDQSASVSGNAKVLNVISMPFDISGNNIRQDWGRVRAEVAHIFRAGNKFSVSGTVASAGQDADLSLGVSWVVLF